MAPDHNSKDVKVINDLIDDLTRLEGRERIPLGHVMTRVHNNNNRQGYLERISELILAQQKGSLYDV